MQPMPDLAGPGALQSANISMLCLFFVYFVWIFFRSELTAATCPAERIRWQPMVIISERFSQGAVRGRLESVTCPESS
jgi:hypothetical protein